MVRIRCIFPSASRLHIPPLSSFCEEFKKRYAHLITSLCASAIFSCVFSLVYQLLICECDRFLNEEKGVAMSYSFFIVLLVLCTCASCLESNGVSEEAKKF